MINFIAKGTLKLTHKARTLKMLHTFILTLGLFFLAYMMGSRTEDYTTYESWVGDLTIDTED